MRLLIFDTETSGLDPQWNVILQLSYQIVDSDSWTTQKNVNHYFSWPDNKARVSYGAIDVNGLTEDFLASKQLSDRKAALEEFVKDKDSCDLLVAHNLEFDKKFIIASCREEGVKYANSGWSKSYDTMKRTASFCEIPKDWGSGYKWPKLTELADCLGVDYSHIALHDSSGDVELTKLCFEGIVAEGLCNLYDIADIPRNLILRVESPDDIRIETEDGELVDEKFFKDYYGLSKKTFNVARQELIMQWSEEKDEERNDLIQIYRKSPKIKTEEDYRSEIEEIKPNLYVRKAFYEQPPSKDKIQEELEQEAEREVSSWMFWTVKKKRLEYVNSRLNQCYQEQLDSYNQRLVQHEAHEDKAEEEYNLQSQKRCEELKSWLASLIEGKNSSLEKELLRVPERMSLSFPYHIDPTLNRNAIDISLLLPQPKDLPNLEGVRLVSGNYKIKEIPDKNKKIDYSNWVWGISLYVAAYYYNISPKISIVSIEGHVKTEDSNYLSLYNIVFERDKYSSLNLENMEIDAALSMFNATNKITKEVLEKLFVAKEKETKQEKNTISPTNNPQFTKEAIDLWSLTSPLTDFADKYEIWEANFYTVYRTLGEDFKGSIFGYVEPQENLNYSVVYASGRYKLTAFNPQGEPIQDLDTIADQYVQWVGLNKCPFVGYVYKKEKTSLPEGVVWIIAPKSREQVLSCASAFYKRRKKKNEIPNIIDLPMFLESSNSIGEITDSTSFVPLRKRMMEGKTRQTATKKRIEEYRATAPELSNDILVAALRKKYREFFIDEEEVAIEAIKEAYRNELPLTLENVMQQLDYLVEDRKLLKYYIELQHIYGKADD